VAVLDADVFRVDGDAIPHPGQDDVVNEAETALREQPLEDVHHHGLPALDQVPDAVLGLVRGSVIVLFRHLVLRH
jgi:hypothetical protein